MAGIHFHGDVRAGTVNNAVHGDITIVNGDLVRAVRAELAAARLPPATKAAVRDALDEAGRDAPAKVRRARDLLREAGGLATAGAGLWTAVRALAAAVGVPF